MPRFKEQGMASYISTADLSASTNLGLAVKLDSSNKPSNIVLATASTDKIVGVLVDTPLANQTGTVRLRSCAGTTFIRCGGSITQGDAVTIDSTSRGITTTSAGDQLVGYAMEDGTTGAIIELMPSTAKY